MKLKSLKMSMGDLVCIKETGAFGIVIEPYAENQPVNGYICKVLTPNSGWYYLYWSEVEVIK